MKRNLIFLGFLVLIAAFSYGIYQYNKPHRNVLKESAEFQLSADDIYNEFEKDQQAATTKYSEKVVEITGTLSSFSKNQTGGYNVLIKGTMATISCEIDDMAGLDSTDLVADNDVTVKGLFVGFDDLLGELQFRKCSLVE